VSLSCEFILEDEEVREAGRLLPLPPCCVDQRARLVFLDVVNECLNGVLDLVDGFRLHLILSNLEDGHGAPRSPRLQ